MREQKDYLQDKLMTGGREGGGVFGMATGFVQFSSVRLVPAAMFRFAVLRSGPAPTLLVLEKAAPTVSKKYSTVQFSSVQYKQVHIIGQA